MSFSGRHFQLDRATMDLKAPPGRLPEIWVGGQGSRMLRLAGRYGDGWYPASVVSPQEYSEKLAAVRASATEAGRDAATITPALHRFVVFGSTERGLSARRVCVMSSSRRCRVWYPGGRRCTGFGLPRRWLGRCVTDALASDASAPTDVRLDPALTVAAKDADRR
jgi:hypothetical protein